VAGPKRVYSDEEVKAILSRAVDRQRAAAPEGLSHDELLSVARDAGISSEAIDAAAAEVTSSRLLDDDEQAVRKERASGFRVHVFTYIPVIAFLAFANAMTSSYPWFFWPAFAWGVALVLHARFALFAADVDIAKAATRRSARRRRIEERERRRAQRSDLHEGARQLGHAVERGVAVILTETAKRIHDEISAVPEPRGRRVRVDGDWDGFDEKKRAPPRDEPLPGEDEDIHVTRGERSEAERQRRRR
jgi:hypothetical protein